MIYSEKSIENILSGTKTYTRRLVKEGEIGPGDFGNSVMILKNNIYPGRIKWQVGKDYAVCPGRGRKCLWYCPKCKILVNDNEAGSLIEDKTWHINKPLRVVIKSIRKEKLLDISEADAKREGYKNRQDFFPQFFKLNYDKIPKKCFCHNSLFDIDVDWNPFVWVLEFEVKR